MSLRVYVAGPYTQGDPAQNVVSACLAADQVDDMGHVSFVPHLSHYREVHGKRRSYEDWMTWCLAWVDRCDVLLRIPGHSPGADREVEHAKRRGLAVVYSLQELSGLSTDMPW